ncbi:MAG TPA: glycosyltransferase [Solirubrobacteraceae bacterium]|nr:glycosyltransferase [Solirubrobacteraceae bacterium]
MPPPVTVAIPVRNGGPLLAEVLDAVAAQRIDRELELLVCDSGSTDGSVALAQGRGARVLRIAPVEFSHGSTRNLLAREARGAHVAFLTQDSSPAGDGWLAALLEGFAVAPEVALVTGPCLPRPGTTAAVARELHDFFAGMHEGTPRVYRLADAGDPPSPGPATFHTDANGAVLRAAWERVPFRPVPFAEDQQLCLDMLRAGYSKVFNPGASVVHSHEYPPLERFRRHFDEFRALQETYGHVADVHPRRSLGRVRDQVRRDRAYERARGSGGAAVDAATLQSVGYHAARVAAAALGSRADAIPAPIRRYLSSERRSSPDAVADS